jgi:hypothetical protein
VRLDADAKASQPRLTDVEASRASANWSRIARLMGPLEVLIPANEQKAQRQGCRRSRDSGGRPPEAEKPKPPAPSRRDRAMLPQYMPWGCDTLKTSRFP